MSDGLSDVALIVQRLSVLLGAGVTPSSAWSYLDGELAAIVASAAERGDDISTAIVGASAGRPRTEHQAWRAIAVAWRVATDAGAPLAASLASIASTLRAHADADREIDVALAGPIATSRLVTILPGIGVAFGLVLGFDTLRILFTTQSGLVCLVAGITLMLLARRWSSRLVARAKTRDSTPGLRLELTAIAVGGGGALDRAEASVARALAECGLDPAKDTEVVGDVLALSRRAGAPAAGLLRSEAEELRRQSRAAAQTAAAILGVKLMLPLGVCVLPAFMLLGVAPLLISIISSTIASL